MDRSMSVSSEMMAIVLAANLHPQMGTPYAAHNNLEIQLYLAVVLMFQ